MNGMMAVMAGDDEEYAGVAPHGGPERAVATHLRLVAERAEARVNARARAEDWGPAGGGAGRALDGVPVWYALSVTAQKEFAARDILERRGFTVFLPLRKKWCRVSRVSARKVEREFALLPGYLFIGFDAGAVPWLAVLQRRFVNGVVGIDGVPQSVEARAMVRLMMQYSQARFVERLDKKPEAGDRCEVVSGALETHFVTVKKVKGNMAETVVRLFGSDRVVPMPLEILKIAD